MASCYPLSAKSPAIFSFCVTLLLQRCVSYYKDVLRLILMCLVFNDVPRLLIILMYIISQDFASSLSFPYVAAKVIEIVCVHKCFYGKLHLFNTR